WLSGEARLVLRAVLNRGDSPHSNTAQVNITSLIRSSCGQTATAVRPPASALRCAPWPPSRLRWNHPPPRSRDTPPALVSYPRLPPRPGRRRTETARARTEIAPPPLPARTPLRPPWGARRFRTPRP